MFVKKMIYFFLAIFLQISLIYYSALKLEGKIYNSVNSHSILVEVFFNNNQRQEFEEYIIDNDIDISFQAFKDNQITSFSSNANKGCTESNHYGFSNKIRQCYIDENDSNSIFIMLKEKDESLYKLLDESDINYNEYTSTSTISVEGNIAIPIIFLFFTCIVLYLYTSNKQKEIALKYLNGWSKREVCYCFSKKFILPLLLTTLLIIMASAALLELYSSDISKSIFYSDVLIFYITTVFITSLLVITITYFAVSNIDIKSSIKNYRNNYRTIVVGYIIKSAMYFATVMIASFSTMSIIELKSDLENIKNYEIFVDYTGYQVPTEELSLYLGEDHQDYVYYSSTLPGEFDQSSQEYCIDEYTNIIYCKSIAGSTKFFEIVTGKKYNQNTVVIPNVYINNTEEIINSLENRFSDDNYTIEYEDDTRIYSFNESYSSKSNDYIENAVWIIYNEYDPKLHNVDYIYTTKDLGGSYYKQDNFSQEYIMYISEMKTNIYTSTFLLITILTLFFFSNYIAIYLVISSKIKVVINKIVNGFSNADIFYKHYTHIIVMGILSGAFTRVILRKYEYVYIIILVSLTLLIFDLMINALIIRNLTKNRLVRFIKGDEL